MHTNVLAQKPGRAKWTVLLLLFMAVLIAVPAVSAAVDQILPGQDVFVGEQNLNITLAVNTTGSSTIDWFNPGDNPLTDVPAKTVTVTNPASFYIDPSIFAAYPDEWYRDSDRQLAFYIRNPYLSVSVYDSDGLVPSGSDRYMGTKLNFRLDTNLVSFQTQRGGTEFVDLYARDPTSVTYNKLYTTSSIPNPKALDDLTIDVTPYFWSTQTPTPLTDLFWNTASRDPGTNTLRYPAGMYTIWAQTVVDNTNKLYTVSNQAQVNLVQETLTVTTIPSVTRSNPFTVNITGRPNTEYTIWILNNPCHRMSGTSCDQPPWITEGQRNLIFDPPVQEESWIANITVVPPQCIEGAQVWQTIPLSGPDLPRGIYSYYANVTTDEYGLASVGFTTTVDTAPLTYTVHVQGIKLDGDPIYADAPITVNKGVVTLNMPSSAILGEIIPISGTNTDSFYTYLYLTGPCQPVCGANLTAPGVPLGPFTIVKINNTARTWVYNPSLNGWDTGSLAIQPGEYTIYASSKPVNACDLGPCDAYATVVITLQEPTISATIVPNPYIRDCCSGTPCPVIVGNTTGNDAHEIEYWVFGDQKIGDKHYYHGFFPDCCGDFEISLCDDIGIPVADIPAGKYYIVLQHPMYNHVFDIMIEGDKNGVAAYQPPATTIIGEQNKLYVISSAPIRWSKVFPIEGADALREKDAFDALIEALNDPGIDDIYVVLEFTVKDANAPTAAFSGYPTSGGVPLGVQFIDQSEGSPTSWLWNFGDGSTSTEQNPYHVYTTEADYTVTLTASKVVNSKTYSDTIVKNDYIHAGSTQLQAAFTADQTVGLKPLSVTFTDQSTGSPTQWFWDFGDGSYSAAQNPTHIYTNTGTYSVTLTASKSGSSSTLTKPNYITVTGSPTPPPVNASQIVLKPGWNFVSTPKILASGYNTGSIFANVDMQGRSAWMWDGGLNPPQWVAITASTPIQPLYGMWIYSASNTVVNLVFDSSNNLVTPPVRSLPAGWNTIGFTGVNPTSARNTYLSVQPNWTTSMGFNAALQQYEPTIFNGDASELTVLSPTKGYWLYMRTPGNLAAIGA